MSPIYNVSEEDNISFYCSMLTDAKAERSYVYVLNMYDKYKTHTNEQQQQQQHVRIPLHVCMISHVNDTDAFRMLLNEVYLIISSEYSFQTKKVELLNYFTFITSIAIPPRHSLLTLKLNYMNVDFYFHSKQELPSTLSDTNINILFSVLDVSKIIKLWICVLQERQIIIYGNKPFLLHAIIDAITKLIFPFKYPYSVISCLPTNNLDLLEMPSIYIMGVLSSCIHIEQLQQKLPETCIVDLETGHIIVKKVKRLPREDEILLKKQIQFVKNPELFEKAELFKSEKNVINNDDVIDMNVTFSTNIQRIFFHLFKQTFKSYKEYIKLGSNKFDEKKYVKAMMDAERSEFWENIMKSAIVDLFITEDDDNSNRSNFDEICKASGMNKKRARDLRSAFQIELTCPLVNKTRIMNMLKEIGVSDDVPELVQALNMYHVEHMQQTPNSSNSIIKQGFNSENSSVEGSDNEIKKEHDYKLVFKEDEQQQQQHSQYQVSGVAKGSNNINMEYSPLINSLKESNFINTIPNQQEQSDDSFCFYDETKGFIAFISKCSSALINVKCRIEDVFFQKTFINELYEQSLTYMDTLSLSGNAEDIIEEKEVEYDDSPFMPITTNVRSPSGRKLSTSMRMRKSFVTVSPIKHNMLNGNSNNNNNNAVSPLLLNEMQQQTVKFKNVINHKMQKIMFYAFYMEDIYFNKMYNTYTFVDKKKLLDHLINMYHKAIVYDVIDFPYGRYMYLLSQLSTDKLNTLNNEKETLPQHLRAVFNEALEKSFEQLRSGLNFKMHFQKDFEPLSPTKKKSFTKKSSTPNIVFEGGSNKLVDFARASKQIKQDYKKEVHTLKKNLSKQELFDDKTSSGLRVSAPPLDLDKYIDSPKPTSEFSFLSSTSQIENVSLRSSKYRFGVSTDFTSQIVLNQNKSKYQTANPLALIIEIGNTMLSFIDTLKRNKIALYAVCELIEYKSTLEKIKKLIDKLQFMNLTKFTKSREKFCFWLNAFNFLVIYGIIYSGFQPQSFEQWDNMLLNCKYDIGRYKYSLYAILVCFLKCFNFHENEITIDMFLQKFLIKDDNVLINFCIYLPLKVDFFELKVYKEEIFEEQTFQTAQMFFKNNLNYDNELEEMVISRYLERVFPMILDEDYKTFKTYIDKDVYDILENKKYQSWRLREINWDVIDYTENY